MKKIYYEKRGRRYVPVSEYDNDLLSSFPKGAHLVICYPGGQSTRYNVDPNHVALIAASRVAEDAMRDAVHRASEMRPQKNTITEGQKAAWENLAREFGDELATLTISSAYDIAQAGVQALQEEAEELMKHESVRHAYEQFLLVCQLTKESKQC